MIIFNTDEYYPKSGSYDFRYKSVECGQTDRVIVDFGSYPQADSVIFKDKYGVKLKVVDGNILTFTGVNQADTNFIYAYRGDQKIGKLFLNTYQRKTYKVVLVSVNGAKIVNINNIDEAARIVKDSLDKVYNQCAVQFEITTDEFTLNDLTSFSHGGSGVLTVYNDDQKRLLTAYEKEKKMQDKTYYLFFVDNVIDKKDGNGTPVSGYMPRGYNAGFIYDGGSPHTIAHELGHGIAGLEHVFENSNNSGKTANLMDYANGEELWHFQWDQIQDPSRVWMKWNKDEGEGENLSLTGKFYAVLNGDKKYRLYDKSEITILEGTDLKFEIRPDEFIHNYLIKSIEKTLKNQTGSPAVLKSIDTIYVAKDSVKCIITDTNNNVVQFLTKGDYMCKISFKNFTYKYTTIQDSHNFKKYRGNMSIPGVDKFQDYVISIRIKVTSNPITRLEPADRDSFFFNFGYDDALIKENQSRTDSKYHTETIDGINYYAPWLNILPNINAEMKLSFLYDEDFVSKFKILPQSINQPIKTERVYTMHFVLKGTSGIKINGTDSLIVLLNDINNTISISSPSPCNGFVYIYTVNDCTNTIQKSGVMEVVCREMKTIGKIKLIATKRIDETEYPQFDSKEILDYVNKYYLQAGVRFDLDSKIDSFTVNVQKSDTVKLSITNNFIKPILNNQTPKLFEDEKIAHIYLLADSDFTTIKGQTRANTGWIYVLLNKHTTLIHELGHALGLKHTFQKEDKNKIEIYRTKNIMDYETDCTNHNQIFYKYQVNIIYNNHKKM